MKKGAKDASMYHEFRIVRAQNVSCLIKRFQVVFLYVDIKGVGDDIF